MGKAIGIDLGTTNTVVAVLLDGRPQVLEDDKGYRVLPSVVTLDDFGNYTVGHAARNRVLTHPDRTVYAIKRLMGRRYDSEQAEEARQRVGYEILPAADGNCSVRVGDEVLSPTQVAAKILQTAREMAERALGEPVDEAVITVPAYFNHQQRNATFEAATVAGMRCERLLNEPTAAALAYGFRRDADRTVVVYDLGGGTFDISVLHLSGGVYEILATRGDTYLGGEDFDYRLVDYLADHFQTQTGFDLRDDRTALQRIKDAAERAKCELSFTDRTTVLVPRITPEANLELAVTRLTLESLVEDLVERTLEVTRRAISEAGLQLADIDDVILVGGQTRMPRVREAISGLFGKEPSRGVHPEEVVAIGAAVHASSLTDEADAPQHVLIDVTPFDLGIDVVGGLFQSIIPRNTHVPTSETRVFATTQDDQDSVRITVRQGDSRFADENEFLGEFVMGGLTPAPRMETKVEVTFRIDSNGMLHATSSEPATGETRRITVRNYGEVAQSKGATAPQVESDGKGVVAADRAHSRAGSTGAPGQVAAAAGAAASASKKPGFLSGLFGRGKQAHEATEEAPRAQPAPQPQPAAPTPADEGASRIQLPEVEPLETIDEGGLEALDEVDLPLEELPADQLAPVEEPAPGDSATIGMAGSGLDAWKDQDEGSYAMPEYDDEDEDEVPVGLAGGAYESHHDDLFALPEDEPEELEEVEDLDPLGGGFEPLDDAFDDLDDFEELEGGFEPLEAPEDKDAPAQPETPGERATEVGFEPLVSGLEEDGFTDQATDDLGFPLDDSTRTDASTEEDPFADLDSDVLGSEVFDSDVLGSDIFGAEPSSPDLEAAGGLDRDTSPDEDPLEEDDQDVVSEPDTGELFEFAAPSDPPAREEAAELESDAFMLPPARDRGVERAEPTQDSEIFGDGGLFDDPGEVFGLPGVVAGQEGGAADQDDRTELTEERLFSVPPSVPPGRASDDERTEIFARSPGPAESGRSKKRRRRKPARLKLAYRRVDAMVQEYRENLRRGGCFVKTSKPLPVGRECIIEVRAPGMDEPLSLQGVVTWSSVGLSALPDGQDPGMGIEYRLDDERRGQIERVLAVLGA